MLRRRILEEGRSVATRHRRITTQMPSFLSSRNFSNASRQSQGPSSAEEVPRSGNYVSKLFLGGVLVGAAAMAAYKTGCIDNIKNEKSSIDSNKLDADKALEHTADQVIPPSNEQENTLKTDIETLEKIDGPEENDESLDLMDLEINREVASEVRPSEEEPVPVSEEESVSVPVKESVLSSFPQDITSTPIEHTIDSKSSSSDTSKMDNSNIHTEPNVEHKATETSMEQNAGIDYSTNVSEASTNEADLHHVASMETPKDSLDNEAKAPRSLAHSYSLEADEDVLEVSGKGETADAYTAFLKDKEASDIASGNVKDTKKSGDRKIILDLIEAIDAAKEMQFGLDAHIFAEEKRKLKEKFEKESKDARARELMYAEETAILDKGVGQIIGHDGGSTSTSANEASQLEICSIRPFQVIDAGIAELTRLLLDAQSSDGHNRSIAEEGLKELRENFTEFVLYTSYVLWDEKVPLGSRVLAALLLDKSIGEPQWLTVSIPTKIWVKEYLLKTSSSSIAQARRFASMAIAKLVLFESRQVIIKQATANTLDNHWVMKDNSIPTASQVFSSFCDMVHLMNVPDNINVAMFDNFFQFIKYKLKEQTEIDSIIKYVLWTTQSEELEIRHAAFEWLSSTAAVLYDFLEHYEVRLVTLTESALEDDEFVLVQALKFWNTIYKEERYRKNNYPIIMQFGASFLKSLLDTFEKQGESHGADELSTEIVTCIIHFSLVLGDKFFDIILPWVLRGALDSNFDENSKTAFVFGSVLHQRLIKEEELYIADTLIGFILNEIRRQNSEKCDNIFLKVSEITLLWITFYSAGIVRTKAKN